MPNSMPFLLKKNRYPELRQIVRKLVPNYPLQADEQFLVPAEDEADDAPIKHLFHEGRGFSTVDDLDRLLLRPIHGVRA